MEYRKVMDIIAYYLSEFDRRAFDEFGFETQTNGFREMAALFGKKEAICVVFGMNMMS